MGPLIILFGRFRRQTWRSRFISSSRQMNQHDEPRQASRATPLMLDISAGDAPAVEATSPRARGVGNEGSPNAKSWKQQKKEAVLRKAGGGARVPAPTVEPTPEPLRVRRDSSEKGDSWAAKRAQSYLSTHGGPRSPRNSQEDMTQPAPTSPRAPGDLSWTEKRKEAYRRKYGLERTEPVAATDVTFSAGAQLAAFLSF